MTRQKIFEQVVYHLFSQGKRAVVIDENGNSKCMYRGEEGSKCAVGCLIPDSEYSEDMEFKTASRLIQTYRAGDLPTMTKETHELLDSNLRLLRNLQTTHDSACSWETDQNMKDALSYIAHNCSLESAFIEDCFFGMENPNGK